MLKRPKWPLWLSCSFQNAVSKYGSQFQGNSQHDALEFLLWLLDRVHEDLEGSARGPAADKVSHPPDPALCLISVFFPWTMHASLKTQSWNSDLQICTCSGCGTRTTVPCSPS